MKQLPTPLLATLVLAVFAQIALPGAARAQVELLGDVADFVVHDDPQPALLSAFHGRDGAARTVADFAGRFVLVNFWDPSCEGSRFEVPTLDALQQTIGGDRFTIVLIAPDNGWIPVNLFASALDISISEIYLDPARAVLTESGLTELRMGSILYDTQGQELGRMDGWANWDTQEAAALIRRFVDAGGR